MAGVLLDIAILLDGLICGPSGADCGLYDWHFNPSVVSRCSSRSWSAQRVDHHRARCLRHRRRRRRLGGHPIQGAPLCGDAPTTAVFGRSAREELQHGLDQ
jgi:hypothetical protein